MTDIRPELSKKHKYWIPKDRYYELLHFCLQYPNWRDEYLELSERPLTAALNYIHTGKSTADPVCTVNCRMIELREKMELVKLCCREADPELESYIFKGVTAAVPFVKLQTIYEIPCSKDTYYDRFRKFFWLLDKKQLTTVRR